MTTKTMLPGFVLLLMAPTTWSQVGGGGGGGAGGGSGSGSGGAGGQGNAQSPELFISSDIYSNGGSWDKSVQDSDTIFLEARHWEGGFATLNAQIYLEGTPQAIANFETAVGLPADSLVRPTTPVDHTFASVNQTVPVILNPFTYEPFIDHSVTPYSETDFELPVKSHWQYFPAGVDSSAQEVTACLWDLRTSGHQWQTYFPQGGVPFYNTWKAARHASPNGGQYWDDANAMSTSNLIALAGGVQFPDHWATIDTQIGAYTDVTLAVIVEGMTILDASAPTNPGNDVYESTGFPSMPGSLPLIGPTDVVVARFTVSDPGLHPPIGVPVSLPVNQPQVVAGQSVSFHASDTIGNFRVHYTDSQGVERGPVMATHHADLRFSFQVDPSTAVGPAYINLALTDFASTTYTSLDNVAKFEVIQ